jgi:hypothetical protein
MDNILEKKPYLKKKHAYTCATIPQIPTFDLGRYEWLILLDNLVPSDTLINSQFMLSILAWS